MLRRGKYKFELTSGNLHTGEACHGVDLSSRENELPTLSPLANLIRSFKSAAILEVASRDFPQVPNSVKLRMPSVTFIGQKALLEGRESGKGTFATT